MEIEDYLEAYFVPRMDGFWQCWNCGYITTLPNKALRHLQGKHKDILEIEERRQWQDHKAVTD